LLKGRLENDIILFAVARTESCKLRP
jgi:hypothetical protein